MSKFNVTTANFDYAFKYQMNNILTIQIRDTRRYRNQNIFSKLSTFAILLLFIDMIFAAFYDDSIYLILIPSLFVFSIISYSISERIIKNQTKSSRSSKNTLITYNIKLIEQNNYSKSQIVDAISKVSIKSSINEQENDISSFYKIGMLYINNVKNYSKNKMTINLNQVKVNIDPYKIKIPAYIDSNGYLNFLIEPKYYDYKYRHGNLTLGDVIVYELWNINKSIIYPESYMLGNSKYLKINEQDAYFSSSHFNYLPYMV